MECLRLERLKQRTVVISLLQEIISPKLLKLLLEKGIGYISIQKRYTSLQVIPSMELSQLILIIFKKIYGLSLVDHAALLMLVVSMGIMSTSLRPLAARIQDWLHFLLMMGVLYGKRRGVVV